MLLCEGGGVDILTITPQNSYGFAFGVRCARGSSKAMFWRFITWPVKKQNP